MRVLIDRALCAGHGRCMEAAPEVFLVVERAGNAQATLVQETPAAALRAKLDAAVRDCPNGALKLVEGAEAGGAAAAAAISATSAMPARSASPGGPRGEFSASDLEGGDLLPDA